MADKAISELVSAEQITATDMFVLEQNGTAKKLTGQVLLNWLTAAADGHGGIQSIVKRSTSGLADTYRITLADTTVFDFVVTNGRGISSLQKTGTSGLVDTYTFTYNDGTKATFTVTNGQKGDKGDNAYIWVKYASQEPTASSNSFGDLPDDWMGVYFGTASTAPTDWQQYKWYRIKGEKGDTGEAATLVTKSVTYQVSGSGTIIPSGAWGSSIPVVSQGKYLWTKTELQFNTGDPIVSYSVARMGIDGSGAVSTVCEISPDENGNVPLTAADVHALPAAGGTMEGPINMNGQSLSGLNAPTKDDEAANKGYVDQHTNPPLPGVIYPYSGANIPDGFLLCDGAAYSRTEYAELFAAIGTMYGSGDGSTTFNVPDLVERVPAGAGDNHPAGEMVGEETHTLTVDEMPSHRHDFDRSRIGMGSTSSAIVDTSITASEWGVHWETLDGFYAANFPMNKVGGSQPHNIMQPTTYIRGYIIATGKGSGVSVQDIIAGVQALPLGIEYGGIGATNAADARKNLGITPENIGALSMELLWENASPTSEFSPQGVSIPTLSNYKMIAIETDRGTFIKNTILGFLYMNGAVSWSVNDASITCRAVEMKNNVVYFMSGYVRALHNNTTQVSNYEFIPVKIYGIKGV